MHQLNLNFGPALNSGLFSTHWLTNRLQRESEWTAYRDESNSVLAGLAELWKIQRKLVAKYQTEQTLEYHFIQPVLEALGWKPNYQTFLQGRKPDYALFSTQSDLVSAVNAGGKTPEFWTHATLVADSKAWGVSLDRRSGSADQREFPPQQMEWYLDRSRLPFGILTNGNQWRLIPRERQPYQGRFDTYFQIRLCDILDQWLYRKSDLLQQGQLEEDFLQFYLFFSPRGFVAEVGGQALVARAISGSSEYRLGIGDDLRKRAFEAVRLCMQGLIDHRPNALNTDEHLERCRLESFTLVYRLLFILYAEDRGLLPYGRNSLYTKNRSLRRCRDEIHGRLEQARRQSDLEYSKTTVSLWTDLHSLFDLVDSGGPRFGVPAYNGGLFDPDEHPFWEEKQLPDWYLARIIYSLGHAKDPTLPDADVFRVDYRDLAIQHLGGVYESLLELQPTVAPVPMIVIEKRSRDGLEEKIVPESSPLPTGFTRTGDRYDKGMVFLQTNKGERRASGSYYTPDQIVNRIVEQTLGPLCRQIGNELDQEIAAAASVLAKSQLPDDQRQLEALQADYDDRVLKLRVLDPSMGSGHFLLRACGYLAEEIATHQYARDEAMLDATGESAVIYWKRKVAETCLFGVDLNGLAVELAKLALWLETVAVDQPLTFLNHHLRTGNSLMGPSVDDVDRIPGGGDLHRKTFKSYVKKSLPQLLEPLAEIRRIPSRAAPEVKRKQRLFEQFERQQRVLRRLADVWCSSFVSEMEVPWSAGDYERAVAVLDKPTKFDEVAQEPWFQAAERSARGPDVRGFAWELEFPDVFFDEQGRLPHSGFDAVIGNPPYDVLSEAESGRDLSVLRRYIDFDPVYAPSRRGKNNLYKLFVCRSLQLVADGGYLGFITPMAVLGDDQAADLRRAILAAGRFVSIDAFPQKDDPRRRVFAEAKLSTAAFVVLKTADETDRAARFTSRVHPGRELTEPQAELELSSSEIPLYDPSNLTIVSCAQADWDLAMRMMGTERLARLGDFITAFQGELNETTDRKKGVISYVESEGPEILRGAHLTIYAMRPASQGTSLYLRLADFMPRTKGHQQRETKASHHKYARVGFQRNSPQNNFRRLIAAVIPKGRFITETISYIPEHHSKLPLSFVAALLNSKLCDWYFRLGSTNAHISNYQIDNLPCPVFAEATSSTKRQQDAVQRKLSAGQVDKALQLLSPFVQTAPFDPLVRDALVAAVDRITDLERRRGDISRTDRSALNPAAQPYQDFIDRVLFQLAGLSDDEISGLEQRLSRML